MRCEEARFATDFFWPNRPLRSARLLLQAVPYPDSGRLVVDLISESATIELTS